MAVVWESNYTTMVLQKVVVSPGRIVGMDTESSDLLSGHLSTQGAPRTDCRRVRIYLCSTATDSCTERTAFVQHVYPKLREYCRNRYGLEFQAVDLAWGMEADDQNVDQGFPAFKMEEIARCQRESCGPNVVAFIGQKYGPRPLPVSIVAEEYEIIRVALHAHRGRDTRNAPLLDQVYNIDSNSVPAVYVRTAPSEVIPELKHEMPEVRQLAEQQWRELQHELCTMLQRGAELAYLDGALDSDARSRFFMSDLEKEVNMGLGNSDQPQKRCVLILRDIVDAKNYVNDPKAGRFMDLNLNNNDNPPTKQVDEDAEKRMLRLKNRAKGLVSPTKTLTHKVLWKFDEVIHPDLHKDYLEKLCGDLHDVLKCLVDDTCLTTATEGEQRHGHHRGHQQQQLVQESLRHWTHCRKMAADLLDCQPQLQQLRDYVSGYSDRPLVLHGPCGSGKTKMLSKLALELSGMVEGNMLSMVRYVGLTPCSSDLRHLLLELCTHISRALGYHDDQIPSDFKDLQRFFPELLGTVPLDTTVVVVLDALDQLLPENNAHCMRWLPVHLPSNVKIVLSTLPDKHQLLQRLQTEVLKDCPSSFVMVQPLSLPDSQRLLNHFLSATKRKITDKQMLNFTERFLTYSLPLYVRLLAEEARALHSFTDTTKLCLPVDCAEAIDDLFLRLESKHGHPVVKRAMAYMVASHTGLSDVEMEDLLSLDDVVLNYIYSQPQHHPPLRRVPYVTWLTLRRDIESFVTEREADGVTVTVWEHDLFVQAIRRRYLSQQDDVTAVHSLLADYFLGRWANKPKPVQLAEGTSQFPPCGAVADRLVPSQPLTFPSFDEDQTMVNFNKRMYDQVPRHLHLSERQVELNTLVLFNYEWLYNKMKALSLQHCLADFALLPGPQAMLVQEALRAATTTVEKDIDNLPAELTGRLLPYYGTHSSIRSLIRSCDLYGLKDCALLPNFPYQQVPGSALLYTLDCPGSGPERLCLAFQERYLLCKRTDSSEVHVFDLLTGELKDTVFTSSGEMHVTPSGQYLVVLDRVTEKSCKIHDAGTGLFLGQVILLNHVQIRTERYHAGPLSLTDDRLCAVVETSDTSFLFICEVPSGNMLQIVGLDGKATVCRVSPDGRHVLCNSNEFLLVYDLYTLQHLCTVPVTHKLHQVAFTADGSRVFLATPHEDQMKVLHLHDGKVEMSYKIPLDQQLQGQTVRAVCLSPNDQLVLVRSDCRIIVHQRLQEKVVAIFDRPEQVPKEFRLPKSHYKDLFFTGADFTSDSQCVLAAIFRNVFIWQISSCNLITTIQAPIGIITSMLVCQHRQQLITHAQGSPRLHVWNLETAITTTTTTTSSESISRTVAIQDKLTAPVQRVMVTSDSSLAIVQCKDSDEVGVFDMRTGAMLDLLTHDSEVQDMAITPSGHMALVVTKPRLSGTACRLWDLTNRNVVREWGDTCGQCVAMHSVNSLLYFSQPQTLHDTPYDLSVLHFIGDTHSVHQTSALCRYVRTKPIITSDDRFIVISSALDYDDGACEFVSPCLVVFDMAAGMKRTCYDASSVGLEGVMEDVVRVMPCAHHESSVAVVVSCRPLAPQGEETESDCPVQAPAQGPNPDRQIGFFVLNLRKGFISAMHFLQPGPDVHYPPRLVFSPDYSVCLDEASCVYNLVENTAISGFLPHPGSAPQCLALNGAAVVYFQGSELYVFRLHDASRLARCQVHAPIANLTLCSDQRTLLVGCLDGTLASYVLVDAMQDLNPEEVIRRLRSSQLPGEVDQTDGRLSRSWDKVEVASAPPYSRPPSAMSAGTKDRLILRQIKPVSRLRPKSDTLMYLNNKSQACCLM